MFKADRIIAVDIGASKVVAAEFRLPKSGAPELVNYGIGELGVAPDKETDVSAYVVSSLREQLHACGIKPAPLFMTISGQSIFPRFVKLPPVARDKLWQIVRYEAEQNVPFPIDEVVWDYSVLGEMVEGDEVSVMLVAAKRESVELLTDCVQAVGMEPEVVEAAPMALYNAVRFNYPGDGGCVLVLDIGARSSALIFIEEDRMFTRSVPIAGNTITQEIAKEFDVSFEEAEAFKKTHGMVGLGGVHAVENATVDRISKIIRNVATRLHAEVNRSVNFYRSQQGGSPPRMMLLTGGTSQIRNLDVFFREKMNAVVEYFNPFQMVAVSAAVDEQQIARDVLRMGEVVGLALRAAGLAELEMNLMPPELVAQKRFRRRQPFFAAAAGALLLAALSLWFGTASVLGIRQTEIRDLDDRIGNLRQLEQHLKKVTAEKKAVQADVDLAADLIARRTRWIEILNSVQACMLDGMWLTSIQPVAAAGDPEAMFIEISGRGFQDKLLLADRQDATALEIFRDRLRASPCFNEKTEIERAPAVGTGAYAREFTIKVGLRKPVKLR